MAVLDEVAVPTAREYRWLSHGATITGRLHHHARVVLEARELLDSQVDDIANEGHVARVTQGEVRLRGTV